MDIALRPCPKRPCPVCDQPRILKVVDRVIYDYERAERLKLEAMLARKKRQLDPAMKLVQKRQ